MPKLPVFPKPSLSLLKKALLWVFLITIFTSTGYFLGVRKVTSPADIYPKVILSRDLPENQKNLDFKLFWQVWDMLGEEYFDKTKLVPSQMVYGSIQGMVSAIGDPYTIFLPPSENKVVEEDLNGSFEGVGIQIGFKGTQLAVIAPLPDSPAEEAGIKPGDLIIGIADEQKGIDRGTVGITLPEAVKLIRGKAGSSIKLTLLRDGSDEPIFTQVTRKNIDVPSVTLDFIENAGHKYADIKLMKFGADTQSEWDKKVIDIQKEEGVDGIVVDVRNNPGGYLQSAVDIASEFLPTNTIVVIEENSKGVQNEFRSTRVGRLQNLNTVVLINGGSASASEILAGSLRDQKKTKLVGEKSFGKGTIQEPKQIEGGAGLHVTIARWLTPSGFWVNEKGLTPDNEVKDNPDTPEDEQLLEAVKLLDK